MTERMDDVEVIRYRYAPERLETLVNNGGIINNIRRAKWKALLIPGFVLAQAWHAHRILQRNRIDIIHAHWLLPQGIVAATLGYLTRSRAPFVTTSHGGDLYTLHGRLLTAIKKFVIRQAKTTTVVSNAMRDYLHGEGIDAGKIIVMPMGVDMKAQFIPDLNVRRSTREILFVGRLVEKKGLRYLLDAMPEVLRHFPDAHVTVAGFGPEADSLSEKAKLLGIEPSVKFLGAVPQKDLPYLYRRAAILVAPFVRAKSGDMEGLGLVLIEAIGCCCPILAGRNPALPDIMGSEFSDMAFNSTDAKDIARALIAILATPDNARVRAEELRISTQKNFDWEIIAKKYGDLFLK